MNSERRRATKVWAFQSPTSIERSQDPGPNGPGERGGDVPLRFQSPTSIERSQDVACNSPPRKPGGGSFNLLPRSSGVRTLALTGQENAGEMYLCGFNLLPRSSGVRTLPVTLLPGNREEEVSISYLDRAESGRRKETVMSRKSLGRFNLLPRSSGVRTQKRRETGLCRPVPMNCFNLLPRSSGVRTRLAERGRNTYRA